MAKTPPRSGTAIEIAEKIDRAALRLVERTENFDKSRSMTDAMAVAEMVSLTIEMLRRLESVVRAEVDQQ